MSSVFRSPCFYLLTSAVQRAVIFVVQYLLSSPAHIYHETLEMLGYSNLVFCLGQFLCSVFFSCLSCQCYRLFACLRACIGGYLCVILTCFRRIIHSQSLSYHGVFWFHYLYLSILHISFFWVGWYRCWCNMFEFKESSFVLYPSYSSSCTKNPLPISRCPVADGCIIAAKTSTSLHLQSYPTSAAPL